MPDITSTLIAASAGTGKTYQLSLRFLSLLALGEPPEKMIAVTFTRKAAGEFADRILSDLAKGASSDEDAADLATRIIQTLKGTPSMPGLCPGLPDSFQASLTRDKFTEMLSRLVQNLARLNLSTIDSLFSRMASTLTYELGLSSFQMIDSVTERREKSKTLLSLYRDCLEAPDFQQAMETIFIQGIKNDQEAEDMDSSMEKIIASYHELFLDCPDLNQWGNPQSLGIPPSECTPSMHPDQMAELAAILLGEAEAIDTSAMKATPKKALQYYKDFLEQAIDYPVTNYIEPHFDLITDFKEKCSAYWSPLASDLITSWLAEETRRACERTKAAYALIMAFETRYGKSVRNRGRFLFHDVTRILHTNALPEHVRTRLEYRTDCAYNHWMLDEFQDTSRPQWHVLEPFLQEIAGAPSRDRSIFVVGDIKQSIYQWRGGDPALFHQLENMPPWSDRLQGISMNLSYRSSQSVLDFANLVCDFERTAKLSRPEAIQRWGSFERHSSAKTKLDGCSQIWQADSWGGEKKDESTCRTIADLLRTIQPTLRGKTCAILVPTNKYAVNLKNKLDSYPDNFPVELCEDALVGIDSPLGKDLLHFFRWLSSPGDALVRNLLVLSPLGNLTSHFGPIEQSWSSWSLLLAREGYAAVMRIISSHLQQTNAHLTTFQEKRLSVWREEASEFDNSGGTLDEWISHMEGLKRREDPPGNVIRIMTIHKSKGLEFDVVILPISGTQKFSDKTHLSSFKKKDLAGNTTGILLSPNKYIYLNQPSLQKMLTDWEAGQQYEGFCKMYVALTRAVHATYVIMPPMGSTKTQATSESFKTILLEACPDDSAAKDESIPGSNATCLCTIGNPRWFTLFPVKETPTIAIESLNLPPPSPRLIRKTPSNMHGRQANASPAPTKSGAAFGTAVHSTFERILRLDEFNLPEWLNQPTTPEERLVAECLNTPSIRALFTQDKDSRILREQSVEAVIHGNWISGTIDRLILSPGKAHIIDFKTDKVSTPEELINRHSPQLTTYRQIVSQITELPESSISTTLLSTHLRSAISL